MTPLKNPHKPMATVKLEHPIQDGDTLITEVTLQQLCLDHLIAIDECEGEFKQLRKAFEILGNLPEHVAGALSAADVAKLGGFLRAEQGKSHRTGENA